MKLDLTRIAREPGAVLPFERDLDLSPVEWNGQRPFAHTVSVTGRVRNMAGAMVLSARLSSVLSLVCDRCARPFEREKTVEYETLLADQLANGENDDIVLLDADGSLDLDALMEEIYLLEMDTKNLCSEDCKGLCPGGGADLNRESCRCKKEIDPRLAGLARLLENRENDK